MAKRANRGKVGEIARAKALASAQSWPTRESKQEKRERRGGTQQTCPAEDSEAGGVVRTATQKRTVPGKRRKRAVTQPLPGTQSYTHTQERGTAGLQGCSPWSAS